MTLPSTLVQVYPDQFTRSKSYRSGPAFPKQISTVAAQCDGQERPSLYLARFLHSTPDLFFTCEYRKDFFTVHTYMLVRQYGPNLHNGS